LSLRAVGAHLNPFGTDLSRNIENVDNHAVVGALVPLEDDAIVRRPLHELPHASLELGLRNDLVVDRSSLTNWVVTA
jgi:hypothetical protein